MIKIVNKRYKNNKYEWCLYENDKPIIGFDKLSDLKEHFKNSLKIDTRTKEVEVLDEDEFLKDIIFL